MVAAEDATVGGWEGNFNRMTIVPLILILIVCLFMELSLSTLAVGTVTSPEMMTGDFSYRQSLINMVADSGLDHVFTADHVSFHNGTGMDGLINAATICAMHPTLRICIGVYLLALRHPVTVARQLATLSESAPGRVILGVGIGGEDRHEIEVCGIDPRTRGRQTNDCLEIVRALMNGKSLSFKSDFFEFENALITPPVEPAIPIMVGGRADAAIRRAGLYSEGWLGAWCSANRFAQAKAEVEEYAANANRADVDWQHGLQVWAGFDNDETRARSLIAEEMQEFYKVPYEAFEKFSPSGPPEKIAAFLKAYQEAGCTLFNIKPCAASEEKAIEAVARVRELLISN